MFGMEQDLRAQDREEAKQVNVPKADVYATHGGVDKTGIIG